MHFPPFAFFTLSTPYCFLPLAGYLLFYLIHQNQWRGRQQKPMGNSRPLSEHLLFLYVMKALGDKFVEPFSSPIGESTFSTEMNSFYNTIILVFVPYRGIYFLYHIAKFRYEYGAGFSSPIGESTFSTK